MALGDPAALVNDDVIAPDTAGPLPWFKQLPSVEHCAQHAPPGQELFDDAERAALALTEAATRLADRPGAVTDDIWDETAKHFDERQLGALVLMVGVSNFFNRINTTLRVPPGTLYNWPQSRIPGGSA